jgi:hypothetical protein
VAARRERDYPDLTLEELLIKFVTASVKNWSARVEWRRDVPFAFSAFQMAYGMP